MKKKYFHHDEKTVYLEEVPLSNMLTMENNVKQIAPSPANKAVNIGINGIRLASLNSSLHILDSKITLLEIL